MHDSRLITFFVFQFMSKYFLIIYKKKIELKKLLAHFDNNRSKMAKALNVSYSTVDNCIKDKSQMSDSTALFVYQHVCSEIDCESLITSKVLMFNNCIHDFALKDLLSPLIKFFKIDRLTITNRYLSMKMNQIFLIKIWLTSLNSGTKYYLYFNIFEYDEDFEFTTNITTRYDNNIVILETFKLRKKSDLFENIDHIEAITIKFHRLMFYMINNLYKLQSSANIPKL